MRSKKRLFMLAGLVAGAVALGCQAPPQIAPSQPRTVIYGGGVKLDGNADMALVFERDCPEMGGFGLKQTTTGGLDSRIKVFHVRVSGPNLIAPIEFDMGLDAFGNGANCQATSAFYGVPDGDYVIEFQGVDDAGGTIAFAKHPVTIAAGQTLVETVKCDFNTGKLAVNIDCCVSPAPVESPSPTPAPSASICVGPATYEAVTDTAGKIYVTALSGVSIRDAECQLSGFDLGWGGLNGIDLAADGYLWVAAYDNGRVFRVNPNNPAEQSMYVLGGSPYNMHPERLRIAPDGSVWVSDLINNHVVRIMPNATAALEDDIAGPFPIDGPAGGDIRIKNDHVYVVSIGTGTVTKFDMSGNKVLTFSDPSITTDARGLAIDEAGNVWITRSNSDEIAKFRSDGTLEARYPVGDTPHGIVVDNAGNLWVANSGGDPLTGNSVWKLAGDGQVLAKFTNDNTAPNAISNPQWLTVDQDGSILVVSRGSGAVTRLYP